MKVGEPTPKPKDVPAALAKNLHLAGALPRPKSILAVSAHWYLEGTFTTANERPETIHDFGGFPQALFRVEYPPDDDARTSWSTIRVNP